MTNLNNEERLKFSTIMYPNQSQEKYGLDDLTQQERKKLQSIYAQKIAYETVNEPFRAPQLQQVAPPTKKTSISIIETICCCFYPEQQRDKFDITTGVFLKRLFGTFLFCKSNWCQIGDSEPQLYGYLWLNVTYIITLTIASNLNKYYVLPDDFQFKTDCFGKAAGITFIFSLILPFAYPAILRCLGGFMSTMQSQSLYGYSLFLTIIPTAACIIPSLFWHISMLALAGVLKTIFLFRNYTAKLDAKQYVFLGAMICVEALYFLIVQRVFFAQHLGSSLDDATKNVFKHLRFYDHQI